MLRWHLGLCDQRALSAAATALLDRDRLASPPGLPVGSSPVIQRRQRFRMLRAPDPLRVTIATTARRAARDPVSAAISRSVGYPAVGSRLRAKLKR
jgi:hypothetical protein